MKPWERPEILEVELEADEDVLQFCWAPSVPLPDTDMCQIGFPCPLI